MKNKLLIGCLAAASVLAASCSDFLDENPRGKITPAAWPSNQAELSADVSALYARVQRFQCNSNTMILQCQGDDATSTTGSNKGAYLSADAFETPSDSKGLRDTWATCYNIIRVANDILSYSKPEIATAEEYNIAVGQAYYWRAFSYFYLVRLYGPLPLVTDNSTATKDMALTNEEGVYAKIVEDLTAAEKCNLPAQYTGSDRSFDGVNVYVSAQTVKATLAAVYMHMAGWPLNKTEYYAQAADKAKEVVDGVNNGTYNQSLLDDYNEVYSYGNNHHNETLLGIEYMHRAGGWSDWDSQLTSSHQSDKVGGGWGDFLAERRFWKDYPDGPRKDAVYAKKIRLNNGVCVDWWGTTDGNPVATDKDGKFTNVAFGDYRPMFVSFTVNDDNGPAAAPYDCTKPFWGGMCLDKRHQLIRYSEVLCWFAESAARSGKYLAEAKTALKQVVARAYDNAPDIDAMGAAELAEQAYKEHGYEVAGYVLAMVPRRSDEFRMNRLKEAYDYRAGNQDEVLVPAGTVTESCDADGNAFTYTLSQDLKMKEQYPVTAPWNDLRSIYHDYPPVEVEKNPNLKR